CIAAAHGADSTRRRKSLEAPATVPLVPVAHCERDDLVVGSSPVRENGGVHGPPNEDLTRRGFDAFAKGDVDTLRELFDQDAVWHVSGRSPLSGDHRGMDAILGNFAKTAELTGGTFRIDLHAVVDNDEHAVAIYVTRVESEGRPMEARQVLVSHIRNGKLTEAWLMSEDQSAADEFFS